MNLPRGRGALTWRRGQFAANSSSCSDSTDIGAVELSATGECKGKAATVLYAPGQTITGGGGKDKLRGGPGRDKLNGGPGKDSERQ